MTGVWRAWIAIGLVAAWFWYTQPNLERPYTVDRARFTLAYSGAREAADYFTRCSTTKVDPVADERPNVVKRFAELRNKVRSSPFQADLELVDLQQQIRSEDVNGVVRDQAICERLGQSGAKTSTEVFAEIGKVESFLAGDRT